MAEKVDVLGEVSTLLSRLQGGTPVANLMNEITRVLGLVNGYKSPDSAVMPVKLIGAK